MTVVRRLAVATVWACALAVGLQAPAAAQQDVVKLAERLNKKAMEDYDALEFESARTTLLSAIAKLRDAGQDETPTAAKVYISLGTVYVAGLKDKNRGVQQFVEALKIDGTVQVDPERATPELQEAFDEAVKKVGPLKKRKPPEDDGTTAPPVDNTPAVHGLQHNSIDEAKAGQSVEIRAQLGSDVAASRLFLFYRGGGQEDYVSVPMTVGDKGDWVGVIPADIVQGKTIQYYIEARDNRGRPAIASGSGASPYIISVQSPLIEDPNKPKTNRENPLEQFVKNGVKPDRGWGRMFVHLMVGTDLGVQIAGNKVEVANQYQQKMFKPVEVSSSGLVSGPLHGTLEIGVNITRHVSLSVLGRLEGTLVNNAESTPGAVPGSPTLNDGASPPNPVFVSKATLAPMGLLRLKYTFGEKRFRPSLHLDVGGGLIRHVFNVSSVAGGPPLVDSVTAQAWAGRTGDPYGSGQINKVCADTSNCIDTISIGYIFAGVGASFYYDVARWKNGGFGILFDITGLTAFGGNNFGVNFDITAGFGAHFL